MTDKRAIAFASTMSAIVASFGTFYAQCDKSPDLDWQTKISNSIYISELRTQKISDQVSDLKTDVKAIKAITDSIRFTMQVESEVRKKLIEEQKNLFKNIGKINTNYGYSYAEKQEE